MINKLLARERIDVKDKIILNIQIQKLILAKQDIFYLSLPRFSTDRQILVFDDLNNLRF